MQPAESRISQTTAAEVVTFWREAGPNRWFSKNEAFDAEFRERFLAAHEDARAERLAFWVAEPEGALALLLLLDQFPRNSFRDTPRMYDTDALARAYAERAVQAGFDDRVDRNLRIFFYLPFEHSERMEDQDRSLALHEQIGFADYARHHRDLIVRFGRFPHRNAILGRTSTAEEQAFLDAGGFAG
jgi:uncharacterized protein (DUF924 family)